MNLKIKQVFPPLLKYQNTFRPTGKLEPGLDIQV